MLLPYNVDRPARREPRITYALIAVNVLIFLLSSAYSNFRLFSERDAANNIVDSLQQKRDEQNFVPGAPGFQNRFQQGAPLLFGSGDESADSDLAWTIVHRKDWFTFDVHPDTMALFAYHVASPTLLAFISPMFLHADLEHILGNMGFLWVFGRATEDALGERIYLAAYFVCGLAATMLYHLMTIAFAPTAAVIPSLGASGAIAGVQGLFAPRFYRTPVRLFYTNIAGSRIFYLGALVLGAILNQIMGSSGFTFGALIVLAAIIILGDETLWNEFKMPAAWLISLWVLINDVLPAMLAIYLGNQGGGVAHWAHIGGLGCGVIYALLIGSQREGKSEYLVEEARRSLDSRHGSNALETAQQVVKLKPNDPVGYQLLGEAYEHRKQPEEMLENFNIAIEKYLAQKEGLQAVNLYLGSVPKNPHWVLPPKTQIALAAEMAKEKEWKSAAETIVKVPYYHPDAPQSEGAFLRGAQLYLERLDRPEVTLQLLSEFKRRYPNSQWNERAETLKQKADARQVAQNSGAPEADKT